MRKILLLLGLILVILPIIVFVPKTRVENVSATTWTGLAQPECVSIGDYDNDGLNDIAFSDSVGGTVTVYKSNGTTIIKQWTGLSHPVGVAIGDYNNDGLSDIAIAENQAGRVTVYKNDGTTIIKQWTGLGQVWGTAIGDYDNDGLNDIAINDAVGMNPKVKVYWSDGTMVKQWIGMTGAGVAVGDYDNDGINDIAFEGVVANTITIYRNDGTTILKKLTGLTCPYGLAIGDYNNDGLNDLAFTELYGGRVTVYYQTKPGTVARVAEPTIVTLRGTLTDTAGYPIPSGSIRVAVKNSFGTQLWQDTFDNVIDNGRYNIPLGIKTKLVLIKGQIYSAILEVDAEALTFVSADIIIGDNDPAGDLVKFVAG